MAGEGGSVLELVGGSSLALACEERAQSTELALGTDPKTGTGTDPRNGPYDRYFPRRYF